MWLFASANQFALNLCTSKNYCSILGNAAIFLSIFGKIRLALFLLIKKYRGAHDMQVSAGFIRALLEQGC
jgi:hypothetical protein